MNNLVPTFSGWVVNTKYWAPDLVDYFEVTFEVPPEPSLQENQQIMLWPGLEFWPDPQTEGNGGLLQPVLTWGKSHSGGGPLWSISSWYYQHGDQDPTQPQSVCMESGLLCYPIRISNTGHPGTCRGHLDCRNVSQL